jgi:hypothetical protein
MRSTEVKECGVSDYLQSYFRGINEVTLLSAAEKQHLAEATARGDRDARGRMIQANLRLVVRIARDYVGRGMILDDLIGEGNLGMQRLAARHPEQVVEGRSTASHRASRRPRRWSDPGRAPARPESYDMYAPRGRLELSEEATALPASQLEPTHLYP